MKERPILFSAPMVRAILAGKKTQTRRIVKLPHVTARQAEEIVRWEYDAESGLWLGDTMQDIDRGESATAAVRCPYGMPGDRLWVRETWGHLREHGGGAALVYRADRAARSALTHNMKPDLLRMTGLTPDLSPVPDSVEVTWRPSIHMPRWASRITLAVDDVRVERLQDIPEADARAEGVTGGCQCPDTSRYGCALHSHRSQFAILWDAINGDRAPWKSNPWVWVVTFSRVRP